MIKTKLWVFKLTSLTQFQIKYAAPPNKFIHYKSLKRVLLQKRYIAAAKICCISISGFERFLLKNCSEQLCNILSEDLTIENWNLSG